MHTVISRATCDNNFVDWHKNGAPMAPRRMRASVLVRGKANTHVGNGLVLPCGVTHVSDEAAEFLRNNPTFLQMQKDGFMEIVKGESSEKEAAKVAAVGLQKEDGSAPLTEARLREISTRQLKVMDAEYGALVYH